MLEAERVHSKRAKSKPAGEARPGESAKKPDDEPGARHLRKFQIPKYLGALLASPESRIHSPRIRSFFYFDPDPRSKHSSL
jgi:hypothetical protein